MTRKKMPGAKPPARRAVRSRAAKFDPPPHDLLLPLWAQTSALVQRLMQTLEEGIAAPHALPEHWERVFGAKDSAVANLQKLVAVLTILSERLHVPQGNVDDEAQAPVMRAEDMEMVMRWAEREWKALAEDGEASAPC